MAALYGLASSGYHIKPQLIKKYDWVSKTTAEDIMSVLSDNLIGNIKYEVPIEISRTWNGDQLLTIYGRIDALTNNNIWELKCCSDLGEDHLLQLAVYIWMTRCSEDDIINGSPSPLFGNKSYRNNIIL